MKIYRIENELERKIYIIASNINNAIKKFEEQSKNDEENLNIKEIKFIGLCVIGE